MPLDKLNTCWEALVEACLWFWKQSSNPSTSQVLKLPKFWIMRLEQFQQSWTQSTNFIWSTSGWTSKPRVGSDL